MESITILQSRDNNRAKCYALRTYPKLCVDFWTLSDKLDLQERVTSLEAYIPIWTAGTYFPICAWNCLVEVLTCPWLLLWWLVRLRHLAEWGGGMMDRVPPHYDDHAQPQPPLGHTQCRNQPVPRVQISYAAFVTTLILSCSSAGLGWTSWVENDAEGWRH